MSADVTARRTNSATGTDHMTPLDWQQRNGHVGSVTEGGQGRRRMTGVESLGKRNLLDQRDRYENARRLLAAQRFRDEYAAAVREPQVTAPYQEQVDGGTPAAEDPVVGSDAAYRRLGQAVDRLVREAGQRAYTVTVRTVIDDRPAGQDVDELRAGLAVLAQFYRV
jgi:hypothetical protein